MVDGNNTILTKKIKQNTLKQSQKKQKKLSTRFCVVWAQKCVTSQKKTQKKNEICLKRWVTHLIRWVKDPELTENDILTTALVLKCFRNRKKSEKAE